MYGRGKRIDLIKNCGHIHQKKRKNIIQIPNIPKEHKQSRQHQSNANVKNHQTDNGVDEGKKMDAEGDMVNGSKHEKDAKGQTEIDERGNVFGQQEHILWHIDFADNAPVCHQSVHTAIGGFLEIRKNQVAAEQVCGVMGGIASKELSKHQPHYQQRQQRRQHAPPHAKHRALVLLLEISLYQFGKEETILVEGLQKMIHLFAPAALNRLITNSVP